jgi:hypothetical protein
MHYCSGMATNQTIPTVEGVYTLTECEQGWLDQLLDAGNFAYAAKMFPGHVVAPKVEA